MTELLSAANSQVLVVDVQERLASAMSDFDIALANIETLARAADALGLPVTVSEQYPKGLGPTLASVLQACGRRAAALAKMHFSCARDPALADRIASQGRAQIVICGLEAHVCVLQTAMDLKMRGMDVFVAADAIASRRAQSKEIALRRLGSAGVRLVTTEMAAFEWLERAGTDEFRMVAPLMR